MTQTMPEKFTIFGYYNIETDKFIPRADIIEQTDKHKLAILTDLNEAVARLTVKNARIKSLQCELERQQDLEKTLRNTIELQAKRIAELERLVELAKHIRRDKSHEYERRFEVNVID